MNARTYKLLIRITLSLAMLCLAILPGSAQNTKSSQQSAQTTSQASGQNKGKNLTPPPGKLRGTTNEMRKAAAIRTADRKTQAKMKALNTTTEPEVKQ